MKTKKGKEKFYRRKDGLFEASRTINGRRVVFRGRTCKEVDQKILEYTEEKEKGRPFKTVAREWLNLRERDLSTGSYLAYNREMERAVRYFGTTRMAEIEHIDVRGYIQSMEIADYAKSTISMARSVVRQIFDYAIPRDVRINPAERVPIKRGKPAKKRRALTEEEEARVLTYRGEDWLMGILFYYTGLRMGEMMALEWTDIDRKKKVIHVTKKVNYSDGSSPKLDRWLKSENGARDVPLMDELADFLPSAGIGKIFANEDGGYLTSGQFYKQRWAPYRAAVGLPEEITPHYFRHNFSTLCFEAGVDYKTLAAFLGDTEDVALEIYTELRGRTKQVSTEKMNAYLAMRAEERLNTVSTV